METKYVSDQIIEVLEKLAEGIGVATDKLYPILIKQAYVEGIRSLVFSMILIGVAVLCIKSLTKTLRKMDEGQDDWEYVLFFSALTTLAASGLAIKLLYTAVAVLANPEWYAIETIIGQLTK